MGKWQLWIDEIPRPGWANMAIDQGLLDRAEQCGESWLRLYQWEPSCLSFGRHEAALRRYDADRIRRLGLDTVRRPTGGRAVWHCGEVTYAVAASVQQLGSLQTAYLEIHQVVAAALEDLGTAASLAAPAGSTALDAGACFARAAGGEVMVSGRKVVGSAQLRCGDALLQHGSIMLEDDQALVADLTLGSSGNHPAPATPLARLLGRKLGAGEVVEAVARAASLRWQGVWSRVSDSAAILKAAAVHIARFQSPAWTWAR
jgi:lipoyl(octanoyl) transferase